MHILYIHQYFATPRGATGTRSYEFALRFVRAGHRVTMLTTTAQLTDDDLNIRQPACDTPTHPHAPTRDRHRGPYRRRIDGIDVLAFPIRYEQTMGRARRILAFLRFMLAACWHAVRLRGVDVIYATSTPLTVGVPALVARALRRRPFVFEVRDLWPDGPIAFGLIRNRFLIGFLHRLERGIYRRASAVVALSPGTADQIRHRSPQGKRVDVVPNCADTDTFRPDVDGTAERRARGWQSRFVCLHAGAMGQANGLDLVLTAADHFRDDPAPLFVLIGGGGEKPRLTATARRMGLDNVLILDALPKRQMPALFAAADVCLVIVANVPIMEYNSANKLFDALSAGKPVLINYSGWQRDLIENAGAGYGCPLGDAAAFIERLEMLRSDPARRARMGQAGRTLALAKFNRDDLAQRVLDILTDVTSTP